MISYRLPKYIIHALLFGRLALLANGYGNTNQNDGKRQLTDACDDLVVTTLDPQDKMYQVVIEP